MRIAAILVCLMLAAAAAAPAQDERAGPNPWRHDPAGKPATILASDDWASKRHYEIEVTAVKAK
jgi:hypothetical protein